MANIDSSNLIVNQTIETAAPDSSLTIQINPSNPLQPGAYQFQLAVTDDSGNVSAPTAVTIIIADDQKPTAIIDAPTRVGIGDNFTLSGKRSIDVGGGKIQTYAWTLIGTP